MPLNLGSEAQQTGSRIKRAMRLSLRQELCAIYKYTSGSYLSSRQDIGLLPPTRADRASNGQSVTDALIVLSHHLY